MANLTNGNGDFTQLCLQNYQTARDTDEEDEESYSLPSFSNSVRQQLDAVKQHVSNQPLVKSGSLTSLKEIESQNLELRRENFDLKVRLYIREKGKNGTTQPGMLSRAFTSPIIRFCSSRVRVKRGTRIEPEG